MQKFNNDEEIWKNNREKKRTPKRGLFWCICDLTLIGEWNKCKICKRRNGVKRNKK